MSCIGRASNADPELHDIYSRKLLIPAWAGDVSDDEAAYVAAQLANSPRLRQLWEVGRFTRQRKKITAPIAKRLCRWWAARTVTATDIKNSASVNEREGRQAV
jgi:hypothetical protein